MDHFGTRNLQCSLSIVSDCILELQEDEHANLDCNICLEKCNLPYKSSCGHYYCARCITRWLEVQERAPNPN